jgi:hypothetical protein
MRRRRPMSWETKFGLWMMAGLIGFVVIVVIMITWQKG